MRKINRIIVHCTATRPEWMQGHTVVLKIAEIRRWHKHKGWSDIGYHYLIDRDGRQGFGRYEGLPGAHTRGENADSIGVALIGGHGAAATDTFFDHFTHQQSLMLRKTIHDLEREHGALKVHGHNEFAAKGCPGFNVHDWLRSGN